MLPQLALIDETTPRATDSPGSTTPARREDDAPGSANRAPRTTGFSRSTAPEPGHRGIIAPLREARFKVQFSASSSVRDKLQKAEALLGPLHAGGVAKVALAGVVERALDELIEVLEKKRFAKTTRPQKKPRARKPGTRYVPSEVRREVAERDGGRCTFVDNQRRRCEARSTLEFHHRHAFARGGAATAANVTLLCRSHNALEAERDFGSEHMKQARRSQGAAPRRDRATTEAHGGSAPISEAGAPPTLDLRDRARAHLWALPNRLASRPAQSVRR